MGGSGKTSEAPPQSDAGKPGKPPSVPIEEDGYEDGDIATPKPDCEGDDDRPL